MKWLMICYWLINLSGINLTSEDLKQDQCVEIIVIQNTQLKYGYLENRLPIAIKLEKETGVPYQVQIAVDIAESGYKDNLKFDNLKNYNNDSWVTCKCNYSSQLREKHKCEDCCFRAYDQYAQRWMYFKKYKTMEDNWKDKATIIAGYKWFKPNMSFEWYAQHLEGCYAESNKYSESLNWINEHYLKNMKYELVKL
jgi:hypothetical protein